jgi:hypothetical protein
MALGYSAGQPFGDPAGFTRSTQEWEIDNFNDWLRQQEWYQQIRSRFGTGDLSDAQQAQLEQAMRANGVPLAKDFHIDEGGNINQKSRTRRNLAIAGIIGGAALTGGGLMGVGPLAGLGGGGAAAGGVAGSAPVLGGGTTLAANLGGASALPALTGAGVAAGAGAAAAPALGGGTTLAANLGGASALPSMGGAAAAPALGGGTTLAANLGSESALPPMAGAAGSAGAGAAMEQAGAAGGGNWLSENYRDLLRVGAPLGAAAVGRAMSNGGGAGAGSVPPEMQELLRMSMDRMRQQEPLFQAVSRQALAGLPTYAKGGQ